MRGILPRAYLMRLIPLQDDRSLDPRLITAEILESDEACGDWYPDSTNAYSSQDQRALLYDPGARGRGVPGT